MRMFLEFFMWCFYFPLIKLTGLLTFWVPPINERFDFEKKNDNEPLSQSFKKINLKADLCFEFSSEGEFQQIAGLVQDALSEGKRIELVFFSPSVEKATLELASKFPDQIRYLRYPFARYCPWKPSQSFSKWITSDCLVMVRYDLFPEFLLWSLRPAKSLKIIWVTFKKERVKDKSISFYKMLFLKKASRIVFASEADARLGQALGLSGQSYDFRMDQIKRRIEKRNEKFQNNLANYQQLETLLKSYPREKRIIIGNAWPSDLFLFEKIPSDYFVLVVPHLLKSEVINEFQNHFKKLGRDPFVIDSNSSIPDGNTLVLNIKGILCELYADFGKAYVGGGFEVSVHSILEPLVAATDSISCGIINHRSTEFDIAMSMGKLKVVNSANDFNDWLKLETLSPELNNLTAIFEKYPEFRKEIISC